MLRTSLLVAVFAGCVCGEDLSAIAQKVNAAGLSWKAGVPQRFNSSEEAAKLCGTWLEGHKHYVRLPVKEVPVRASAPASFDARTQWSNCSVIRKVRDQSACGSCWAFGSTESFEDRRCIHEGVDVEMSVEDTASCCRGAECGMSFGCDGGQPGAALHWMTQTGVVTGGDYVKPNNETAADGCRPYSFPACSHHVAPKPGYPACPSEEYSTPACRRQCQSAYPKQYDNDKARGRTAHSIRGVDQIMSELMNGPLAVAFTVYEDFVTYTSGVYTHHTGRELGGHAVEMIGWGVENGVDYWICKNSWNPTWGDNGFFKIRKGVNECGIEGEVNAVIF